MRGSSLRLRLIGGGLAAILIALTLAGVALTFLFERHAARTLSDDLDVYLKQLLAGLDVNSQNELEHLTRRLNRLWIPMTARIRFNNPHWYKGASHEWGSLILTICANVSLLQSKLAIRA